jgi:hypothetical protein
LCGEIAGLLGQICIDTPFPPVDVKCCEVTDVHSSDPGTLVVVSVWRWSRFPGNKKFLGYPVHDAMAIWRAYP